MTVRQIHVALDKAGKSVSAATLYQYFRRFKIRPVGVRQLPQRYPEDTPNRILKELGLAVIDPIKTKGKGRR